MVVGTGTSVPPEMPHWPRRLQPQATTWPVCTLQLLINVYSLRAQRACHSLSGGLRTSSRARWT